MDLLIAIQKYCERLVAFGFYPKKKKPSLGKLEKLADLCMAGKFRKLSRFVPDDATEEQKEELDRLMKVIEEIVKNEKN